MLATSTPPARAWRLPVVQVVARQPILLQLALQENVKEVPHAFVIDRIDVVVPLLKPWNELGKAEQKRLQPFGRPAFLLYHFGVPCGQGLSLLQGVPAGPTDEQRRVRIAHAKGVADKAFFGHVEWATQTPVGGVEEVR